MFGTGGGIPVSSSVSVSISVSISLSVSDSFQPGWGLTKINPGGGLQVEAYAADADSRAPVPVAGEEEGGEGWPFAFTNPIWVDADGDGNWQPPR